MFETSGTLSKNELMEIIPAAVAKKAKKTYYQVILVIALLFAIAVVPLFLTSPLSPIPSINQYNWLYWISLFCACVIMIIPLVLYYPGRQYKMKVLSILSNYQDWYGNTCKNISSSFDESTVKYYIVMMKSGAFVPVFKNQLTTQEQTKLKQFISTKVPII